MPIKIRADCSKRNKNKQMPLRERDIFFSDREKHKTSYPKTALHLQKGKGGEAGESDGGDRLSTSSFCSVCSFFVPSFKKKKSFYAQGAYFLNKHSCF